MSDENVEVANKLMEGWNNYDWEAIKALHNPDYVDNGAPPGVDGLTYLKMTFDMFQTGFPGYEITVQDAFSDGKKTVTRWTLSGTHSGEFAGIPATGKTVCLSATTIARINKGTCHESWTVADMMGLMQQLGVA